MKKLFFAALLGSTAMMPAIASAQQTSQGAQQQQFQQGQQAQQGQQQGQQQQGRIRQMQVSELIGARVVNQQGQMLGEVVGVAQREGGQQFLAVDVQDGQRRVRLPLDQVSMAGNQLVARMRDGRVTGARELTRETQAQVQELGEQEQVAIAQRETQMQRQQARMGQQATGAQVRVEQQPAQVMVEQGQPQIIVRQPPPTITVQQPQPEIIVRMPEPDVAVRQPTPQVQVEQAQPQVRVQEEQQAQVRLQQGQPQVSFERTGEPQVRFQEEAGQPVIRYERMAQGQQEQTREMQARQQTQQTGEMQVRQQAQVEEDRELWRERFGVGMEPETTGAIGGQQGLVAMSEIQGAELYNYRGEELGEVDSVLRDPQSERMFLVVEHGGFLGLGDDQVVVPMERVQMQGDRLLVSGITEQDIEQMADADQYANYEEVGTEEEINMIVAE